jgi:hypothetical protein
MVPKLSIGETDQVNALMHLEEAIEAYAPGGRIHVKLGSRQAGEGWNSLVQRAQGGRDHMAESVPDEWLRTYGSTQKSVWAALEEVVGHEWKHSES